MEGMEEHLPWIRGIALELFGKYGLSRQGFNLDELVNIGYEALCKAADKYERGGSATLKTYAFNRVRGEMLNHVNSRLKEWRRELQILDRGGDEEHPGVEHTGSETINHTPTPEEVLLEKEIMEEVKDCVKRLPTQLQKVWRLRAAGMTLEKIAGNMDISIAQAWRYQEVTIQSMQSCLSDKDLL